LYAKSAGLPILAFRESAVTGLNAYFDLSNGTILSGSSYSTINSVGNGWYRCSFSFTTVSPFTTYSILIFMFPQGVALTNPENNNFAFNGINGTYIWGAQLEQASFATSYIPTVASQVTRSDDNASMTGANFTSWYRADEGTLYDDSTFIGRATVGTDYQTLLQGPGSGVDNVISLGVTSGVSLFRIRRDASDQLNISTGGALLGKMTRTIAYKTNDMAVCVNGGTVSTDTLGVIPIVNQLLILPRFLGNAVTSRTVRKIAYYPIRLTNAQLQAITT
jgi:hypothetical protein